MSDAAFFIDIVLTRISKELNVSDHKVSKWVNLVYPTFTIERAY